MADVVIHHCTLRLRRRDGWSWGSDPRRLLELAVRALPILLAQRLAELWPDAVDEEIDTPLTLRIPINFTELEQALTRLNSIGEGNVDPGDLGRRLETVVNTVFGAARLVIPEAEPTDNELPAVTPSEDSGENRRHGIETPIQLLLKWRARGTLETLLAGFSTSSLEAWHRHLLPNMNLNRSDAPPIPFTEIEEFIGASGQKIPRTELDRKARLRRRLLIAVDVAERFRGTAITAQIVDVIDRVLPLTSAETTTTKLSAAAELLSIARTPQAHPSETDHPSRDVWPSLSSARRSIQRLPIDYEVRVSSAIPFLLLGMLARIGYLEALAATFETGELMTQSPLFALALAYKVLDPPERGWRRTPASVKTATAFAGLREPPTEDALTRFAEHISPHLSPLDALLQVSLNEGHQPGEPLLIYPVDQGVALINVKGLFPVAWSEDIDEMLSILIPFGTSVCLIPMAAAEPTLLEKLDAAGVFFVTDAPATRGENWRLLQRGNERWWTNDRSTSENSLLSAARQLVPATTNAEELWRTFGAERPSVPLSARQEFEMHLTIAASVGLGTIAWILWHQKSATTPQMALHRLSDFEARVRFTRDAVRVYLPRGRRFQDLREHRLLADIPGVSWLGGRPMEFVGG